MPRCPDCGETDLHYEYIELRGLGWRPVWHNADGSRHRCGKLYMAMRDTRPMRVILGDAVKQQPKAAPKPSTQSVPPVSRRRTVETS